MDREFPGCVVSPSCVGTFRADSATDRNLDLKDCVSDLHQDIKADMSFWFIYCYYIHLW